MWSLQHFPLDYMGINASWRSSWSSASWSSSVCRQWPRFFFPPISCTKHKNGTGFWLFIGCWLQWKSSKESLAPRTIIESFVENQNILLGWAAGASFWEPNWKVTSCGVNLSASASAAAPKLCTVSDRFKFRLLKWIQLGSFHKYHKSEVTIFWYELIIMPVFCLNGLQQKPWELGFSAAPWLYWSRSWDWNDQRRLNRTGQSRHFPTSRKAPGHDSVQLVPITPISLWFMVRK